MKYLIYARVSERGSGFEGQTTIAMQTKICEDYVQLSGGEVFDRRSDEFVSGKNIDDRPAFREIMEELRSGRAEWDAIIVYKFSRISRSLKDSLNIVSELQERGKGFVSATEHFDCTTTTGQLFFNMLQSFNEFERKRTADTIRDKMVSIAEAGLWPSGKPPFGYRRGARKDNMLYVDERNAERVRDIFAMYLDPNRPVWAIERKYRNVLARSKIFSILRNQVYLGVIPYGGKVYPGQHEPIISKDTFDDVQKKLPQHHAGIRPKAQRYPFLLAGFIYCECGCRMTPESAKSGQYMYYRCMDADHCKRRISAPDVEKTVIDYFQNIRLPQAVIKRTLEKIDADAEENTKDNRPEIDRLKTLIQSVSTERDRVFSMLLCNLSPSLVEMANAKMADLDEELATVRERLALLESAKDVGKEAHTLAKAILVQVKSFSETLEAIESVSKEDLRLLLMTYIDKVISNKEDSSIKVYLRVGSSTNSLKWYTERSILELFCFTLKVA